MTKTQNLAALQAAGQAQRVPLTRNQLLEAVAAYFDQRKTKSYKAPLEIEYMTDANLRAMSTEGHVFRQVENALNAAGVPTDGTMDSVMNALGIDDKQTHDFACNCHTTTMDGRMAAARLRVLKQ